MSDTETVAFFFTSGKESNYWQLCRSLPSVMMTALHLAVLLCHMRCRHDGGETCVNGGEELLH